MARLSPEQESVVLALEDELGRPLTTEEQKRAEAFMARWTVAQAASTYGNTDQGVVADALDRATFGAFSPGETFDRITPSTYELAVAVGGFADPEEVLFGVNGIPIRPDTPALYLERMKEADYYDFLRPPAPQTATNPVTGEEVVIDPSDPNAAIVQSMLESGDPFQIGMAQLFQEVAAEQADDLPKFLGGIPQGTLLPQNLAEVEHNFDVAIKTYTHTNRMLQKELIESGPTQPSYSIAQSSKFGEDFNAPSSNAKDKASLTKTQSILESPVFGEGDYAPTMGSPQYMPMDEFNSFATKDPGYIDAVQGALIAGGLMKEDDFVSGVWTQDAASAMEDAMIEANFTGGAKTWVEIVQGRAESNAKKPKKSSGGGGGGGRRANPLAGRTLVLPSFEAPSTDILHTEVTDLLRQKLGRDPTGWEKTLLADYLSEGYRAQYDAEVVAAKANFEAGNRAILQSVKTGKPVTVTAQAAERVDPRATLIQRFEERYAPELELNQDRELSRENMANVFNVMTSTSRILGGS